MFSEPLIQAVVQVADALRASGSSVTTVESCTGGLVGAALTSLPGSSDYFPGGFITYSNELKQRLVGVKDQSLETYGAVSDSVAREMAMGGLRHAASTYAISITGIAGPGGGSIEKPVGTVWICVAQSGGAIDCRRFLFPGTRSVVREAACLTALRMLLAMMERNPTPLAHEQERSQA